jgi:diphosphomevalonate decarboxylase
MYPSTDCFDLKGPLNLTGHGLWRASACAPSNIALIKYWGKKEGQLPANPSLSFTLKESFTETSVELRAGTGAVECIFEGQSNPEFAEKLDGLLRRIHTHAPYLERADIKITTSNTFPHSAGIASSASSMAALAMALVRIEMDANILDADEIVARERASFLARLLSGSACRSLYAPVAWWGRDPGHAGSDDLKAVEVGGIAPIFKDFKDSILVVSGAPKNVSSSAGHALMESHPYKEARYQRARERARQMVGLLRAGDVAAFGELVEAEALELHALMMQSSPPIVLMHPGTLELIHALWKFRAESGAAVYFTLDAGPNLHLLYPSKEAKKVAPFIESASKFCERIIDDSVGVGARWARN